MVGNNFDWDGKDVAVPGQQAIAVEPKSGNEVVIRQRDYYDDEDDLIYVSRGNVLNLIGGLLAAAGMDDVRLIHDQGDACEDVPLQLYRPDLYKPEQFDVSPPKPKDPKAAERQRRYRQGKRNRDGNRATTVENEMGSGPHE